MKSHSLSLPVSAVSRAAGHGAPLQYFAGLFFALRIAITYIAFQSAPRVGTAAALGMEMLLFGAAFGWGFGNDGFRMKQLTASRTLRWLTAYLAFAGASVLWTQADSGAIAAAYWTGMALDAATALFLLKSIDPTEQLDGLMRGFVMGSIGVALIAWFSPTLPDLRIGNEEFLHPNGLGLEFATAFFCAQYLATKNSRWHWAAAALGISLLRTISKTSIIAALVAESFYLLRWSGMSRKARLGTACTAMVAVASFWGLLEAYFSAYASKGNQAETLTGRTAIWAMAIVMGMDSPWIGHGIYSFRALIPSFGSFQPTHAHNELLQQFFEYGAIGVSLAGMVYFSLFRSARRAMADPYGKLALVLICFALVHGLTDTVNFGLSFPLWLAAAFSIVLEVDATGSIAKGGGA
ncbi:MAG TPA: O-antigen ligase family protein [Acidobacteriaceae bacterium]|nr:O-antigen ligase family protein [Acidobacteriaceae bacterium]